MVKVVMYLAILASLTLMMTMIMSFTALEFSHPFSSELGRGVWILLATWLGFRIARVEID